MAHGRYVLWVSLWSLCSGAALAAAPPVDYQRDIKPLLKERCFACHGALQQQAGLRLDTAAQLLLGGESGPAIVPQDVAASLLVQRVSAEDASERMPPLGKPLTPEQIARISAWIAHGAPAPTNETPEADPRDHWAFRLPIRPPTPDVTGIGWVRNPIDAFVTREHTRWGLKPSSPQSDSLLLRRVYLDLIGLPPTRAQLQAFLADRAPDAYERVVDGLLASPQYGQRWGRHWMDVWRYSDWYGRRMVPDVWNSAPQIWRWRDWIVDSLNADKGYDRMLAEMLAADEIAPEDEQAGYATGYLVRNWYALNHNDWMRSNVEHTGKAFLGLTFNCAHCHDHKYDPITQSDYFRLRAFFEPIGIRQDRVTGEADPGPFQEYSYSTLRKVVRLGGVRIFDQHPDAPTWFYTGGDERNRVDERGSTPPGLPAFLAPASLPIDTVSLPTRAWYPGCREEIRATILQECQASLAAADRQLSSAHTALAAESPGLQAHLTQAQADLAKAVGEVAAEPGNETLTGQQSLLLDASTGRRLVQHDLQHLPALTDGVSLSFQLRIHSDAHINFQLAKDMERGLTAGYIGFQDGRILSYRPDSVDEFEVGRYDFAAGQRCFNVVLELTPSQDCAWLSVSARRASPAPKPALADRVRVALNGWSPVDNPKMGVCFDARPGSVAVIDEVRLCAEPVKDAAPQDQPPLLVHYDFEAPTYALGSELIDVAGWQGSSFNQPPAMSLIVSSVDIPRLHDLARQVYAAQRALDARRLHWASLEAEQVAAAAELASTQARLAADSARFSEPMDEDTDVLTSAAARLERTAAIRKTEAAVAVLEHTLAAEEAKPLNDAGRSAAIATGYQQLIQARAARAKARQEATDGQPPPTYAPLGPTYPATSTGRRRALAQWIADRSNPLTARVAVNHIWMRHFHAPLVATVFDFGRNGQAPTHPELLDWLATDLMDHQWGMKRLHRLIVTSGVYRMTSSSASATDPRLSQDAANRWLWRMNTGRMESEVVRDSVLSLANSIDLRMGGQELENSEALTTYRRTLYYSCHPEVDGKSQFGALFDAPEAAECYRRTRTVVPQQALALTNSELVHQVSDRVAAALWRSPQAMGAPTAEGFIVAAFEHVLSRTPSDAERSACLRFLSAGGAGDHDNENAELRSGLVRALINHNDFITIR